jgi:hypothetical protein
MKTTPFSISAFLVAVSVAQATPNTIDGLRLWLDASDGATINTSGGQVTQWSDKSGFNNHATQADTARQPVLGLGVLGGQNAVRFDALGVGNFTTSPTDDGLTVNNALNLSRNYSIYLVDQYWGTAAQGRTLTSYSPGRNWLLGHWDGRESHYSDGFYVGGAGGTGPVAGINNPLISEAIGAGASNYLYQDLRGKGYTNNTALQSPGNLIIGEDSVGTWNEGSQADVGEVIAFARGLTDTERWAVQDYLRVKYNQATPLSRAHPTHSTVFRGGDAGDGLDFQGNFLAAVNVGGPGGFNVGNATFTSDTGVTAENHIPGWFGANFGATPDDDNLETVMTSIRWSNATDGGTDEVTVNLPGLIAGNTYKLQLLFAEAGINSSRHHAVEVEGKMIHRDYAEGTYRGIDNPNGMGNALIHEFVAGDSNLNVRLHSLGLSGGDLNQLLSGYTVENRGVTGVTTTGTFVTSSQLDLTGNFAYAVTVGGAGGQTVDGVTFTNDGVAGVTIGAENVIGGWVGGVDFTGSGNDVALGSAMSSIRWSATEGYQDGLSLDLAVTPGEQYKLQLMFMEGCCDRGFDVSFEGVLTTKDFNPFGMGATGGAETGAVITHTFTAADGNFSVMLDGWNTAFADRSPIMNAFTLERLTVIPEPATALLGLLAGALFLRRRR